MALTAAVKALPQVQGARRDAALEVTFDASYTTGGLSLTPSQFGLTKIDYAIATLKTAGAGSVTQVWYDTVNSKLLALAAAAEVANATSLATVVASVVAFGS